MDKIIIAALFLGAAAGLADGMLNPDGALFSAVRNVVDGIANSLNSLV